MRPQEDAGLAALVAGTDPELAARLNAWMWDRGG